MAGKTCTECKKTKAASSFHKNKQQKDGLSCYCKECTAILRKGWKQPSKARNIKYSKKYHDSEKGKRQGRNASYKHRYGFSLESYEEMFDKQRGKCAMCGNPSDRFLVVDHNHDTDKVRALLCFRCNTHFP